MSKLNFLIIPLDEEEDADLIRAKDVLLHLYDNPDEPGEAPYRTGRHFADLIRTGLHMPDGENDDLRD